MTIALLDASERTREAYMPGAGRDYGQDVILMPFSGFWETINLRRHLAPVSIVAHAAPMTVQDIEALLPETQFVDIAPSDNDTTYIEWQTSEGFASLEVGRTRFAFSFIPDDSRKESVGEVGALTERNRIAELIRKHS